MKREPGEKGELSRLTEERKWLRSENIHQRVKGKVRIALVTKLTLGSDHCYLGLRPTVDTALIPLLSHPVLRTKPNA